MCVGAFCREDLKTQDVEREGEREREEELSNMWLTGEL